jgi:hypothetical protein
MSDDFTAPGCANGIAAGCFVNALNELGYSPEGYRLGDDWLSDGRQVTAVKTWGLFSANSYAFYLENPGALHGFCVKFYRADPNACPDGSVEGEDAIGSIVYSEYCTDFTEEVTSVPRTFAYCVNLPLPFDPDPGIWHWVSITPDFDLTTYNGSYTRMYLRVHSGDDGSLCETSFYGADGYPWQPISQLFGMPCLDGFNLAFALYSSEPAPTGACCYASGACSVISTLQCGLAGGAYQGDASVCDPNPCPQPIAGACCDPSGSCLIRTEAVCQAEGGSYWGDNTSCEPNPCPQPTGACCFADGSCIETSQEGCSMQGGSSWLASQACAPNPCAQHEACCLWDGGCVDIAPADCQLTYGGVPQGAGTACVDDPCPQAQACCYIDGSCTMAVPSNCGGILQGEGSVCEPTNPCEQPQACCLPSGDCYYIVRFWCPGYGGWAQGAGTVCDPNPCPQPEACCLTEGSCALLQPDDCSSQGGIPQGPGSSCTPNPCPHPCTFPSVAYDWDFTNGNHGFSSVVCDANAVPTWEYGVESSIPGSGVPMWGTSLNGDYPNGAGDALYSPPFAVTAATRLVELTHYRDIDPARDGCNVKVQGQVLTPMGGYDGSSLFRTESADPSPGFLAKGAKGTGQRSFQRVPGASIPARIPGGDRSGGEMIDDAVAIPGLPFADTGNTCGRADDYDETCPFFGPGSADVVYSYVPTTDQSLGIDLCASEYDTKVYVYQDAQGSLVACNDDAGCGFSGFQSRIEGLQVAAGSTYYIVIDGYAGECGAYALTVRADDPATCIAGEQVWSAQKDWTTDCFDLSAYMGQTIQLGLEFGSNSSGTAPGWYVRRIQVGGESTGACCFAAGWCATLTPSDCAAQSGSYQGDATFCDPNPCPQPMGACCLADRLCQATTEAACAGTWLGMSTDCDPNPCPLPCPFQVVEHVWNFPEGEHGFTTQACADGGLPVWQYGLESTIPGSGVPVWGTILNGNYPDLAGDALVTPSFTVTESSRLLEVTHYVDTQDGYDGCNVKVGDTVLEPMEGYANVQTGPEPDPSAEASFELLRRRIVPRPAALPSGAGTADGRGCIPDCPPEGLPEGEPHCDPGYVDNYNGGCWSGIGSGFQRIELQGAEWTTICGISCAGDWPDWDCYEFIGTGDPLSVSLQTELFEYLYLLKMYPECGYEIIGAVEVLECSSMAILDVPTEAGATYAILVVQQAWGEAPYTLQVQLPPPVPVPCVDGEPTWSGAKGWMTDCFDLSAFMGQTISVAFEFGSNTVGTAPGWYIQRVTVGGEVSAGACCLLDGTCVVLDDSACASQNGSWTGAATVCEPGRCILLPPEGAPPYASIQEAVDGVVEGGVVMLTPGTYVGLGNRDINPGPKSVVIRGDPGGGSVIDCGSPSEPHRAFVFDGAGAGCMVRDVTLIDCASPSGARTPSYGGAISCVNSSPTFDHVAILGGVAQQGGGAIHGSNAHPTIQNCTLAGCSAPLGGGIYLENGSTATIDKTIIASSVQGDAVHCLDTSTAALTCSDVYGNAGGDWIGCIAGQDANGGNVSADPLFCDPDGWVYTLRSDSPCAALPGCGLIGSLPVGCAPPDANIVGPVAPSECISTTHPCVMVPVNITRADATPMRGFSVRIALSAELALCSTPAASITQGDYLTGTTSYHVADLGGGVYVVDCAILGNPCGATALEGNLFNVSLKNAGNDGTGALTVVVVLLRDCANVPMGAMPGPPASITIDHAPPAAIADLSATQVKSGNDADGTTRVHVGFTAPGDAVVIEVYRKGFGAYPEYDDAGGAPPTTPGYPPSGWTLTGLTAPGDDEPPTREYWYYAVFTRDACGNQSVASNLSSGTLNYHLGDTHDGTTDCAGDNAVAIQDVSFLGGNYGISLGDSDPLACLDVGPTTDGSTDGRPLTDNQVDFEDLMIFALNLGEVGFHGPAPALIAVGPVGRGPVRLAVGPTSVNVRAGAWVDVPIHLTGEADGVQGVRTILTYDPELLRYGSSTVAPPIDGSPHFFKDLPSSGEVDLNLALLGWGMGMSGEGTVFMARFQALRDGRVGFGLMDGKVRDRENLELLTTPDVSAGRAVETPSGVLPTEFRLGEARPNPFSDRTTIFFELPVSVRVQILIYDVSGRLVRTLIDETRSPGGQSAEWDGADDTGRRVGGGIYFYAMRAGGYHSQRRMTLLR